MPILAIETATLVSSVALATADTLLAEITLQTKKTHSELLMPHIATILESAGVKKSEIMEIILSWFGTPYKFGGTSDNAIDCSAFVRTVYSTATEMQLPRTAREQFTVGKIVRNRKDLKFGDMVFFNTRKRVRVSHVGIYLGDNLFAHASSRSGVTVSSLVQDYYNKKFIGARRISYETVNQLSTKTDRNQPTN